MNIKSIKNIANKLRQGFRFSHLICLSIGVLIPIYADVLFLHEFNSSTVSAIMDTVMATAAISAAMSVRGWLKDKLKNKGFEQTDKIISEIYMMLGVFDNLRDHCIDFTNKHFSGIDLGTPHETIMRDATILREISKQTNDKLVNVLIALKNLPVWGMHCKNEDKIIAYLDAIDDVCLTVNSITDVKEDQIFLDRLNMWEDKKPIFDEYCSQVLENFHVIEKNYDELFTYEPRKINVR